MEAYARGDLDTALTHADPDIAWNPVEEAATQGHDAIRANLERWETDFEDFEATPEEYIDAGDQVLATIHWSGRGPMGRVLTPEPVRVRFAHLARDRWPGHLDPA